MKNIIKSVLVFVVPILWLIFGYRAIANSMEIHLLEYIVEFALVVGISIWAVILMKLKIYQLTVGLVFYLFMLFIIYFNFFQSYGYPEYMDSLVSKSFKLLSLVFLTIGIKKASQNSIDAVEKVKLLAFSDPLTNLANRRQLSIKIDESIETAAEQMTSVAYLMLDFDNFKYVNDTFGHEYGDNVLIHITNSLREILDRDCFIGRLGGDEFLIIIENLTDTKKIIKVCKKMVDKFNEIQLVKNNIIHISVSIGISVYPDDGDSHSVLLQKADMAMYNVKKNGKNNYEFFSKKIEDSNESDMVLKVEIINALKMSAFEVYYQPIVSLKGKPLNYEALIRWSNDNEMVSPKFFIPIAEKYGLISKIDYFVLNKVCDDLKIFNSTDEKFSRVSVNLSSRTVMDPELLEKIQSILKEKEVSSEQIIFEITETALLQNEGVALAKINQLREVGFLISLDDFGTGFSSLNHLKRFPIDSLKIDKSFIDGIGTNEKDEEVVKAILNLANALSINSIAEGVEQKDQVNFLLENDCKYIQGYYYSKPYERRKIIESKMNNEDYISKIG